MHLNHLNPTPPRARRRRRPGTHLLAVGPDAEVDVPERSAADALGDAVLRDGGLHGAMGVPEKVSGVPVRFVFVWGRPAVGLCAYYAYSYWYYYQSNTTRTRENTTSRLLATVYSTTTRVVCYKSKLSVLLD